MTVAFLYGFKHLDALLDKILCFFLPFFYYQSGNFYPWWQTPRGKRTKADIIMVDPLEAKRLAAQQMQEIKAREKRKVSKLWIYLLQFGV